jgi:16S rRNA processing protein RimM
LTPDERPLPVGQVGRAHGLDGSFYVERVSHPLSVGDEVTVDGRPAIVERWAGTAERPLLRVSGVSDRDAASALRGAAIETIGPREELGEEEWYDDDLVGCEVVGLGAVRAVIHAPSCDLLEVGDAAVLVPLIRDAVLSVDLDARRIEIDRAFLGLDQGGGAE